MKQQPRRRPCERYVAELVNDAAAELVEFPGQPPLLLRFDEQRGQLGGRQEPDPIVVLAAGHAQGDGVGRAGTDAADQHDVGSLGDEGAAAQLQDRIAVEPRLHVELEGIQGLEHREAGLLEAALDAAHRGARSLPGAPTARGTPRAAGAAGGLGGQSPPLGGHRRQAQGRRSPGARARGQRPSYAASRQDVIGGHGPGPVGTGRTAGRGPAARWRNSRRTVSSRGDGRGRPRPPPRGRGGIGFQQPQQDPLLIRLARLLPEGGPDLLPHRASGQSCRAVASGTARCLRSSTGSTWNGSSTSPRRETLGRVWRRPRCRRQPPHGRDTASPTQAGRRSGSEPSHPVRPDVPELVDHPRLGGRSRGGERAGPAGAAAPASTLPGAPVGEPAGRQVRLQLSDDQRVERGPARDVGRGRNTRLRTYLTPVSTEPFSQPFAGAQNAAANGYAPRNA